MSSFWETQARKAQDILQLSIPKQWMVPSHQLPSPNQLNVTDFPRKSGILTDRELAITELSATALVATMGQGRITAEEVVVAFLKRSVIGHQLLNFATEFMAEKAISRAKELDKHYRETGKLVGPLHGVPISVKEHIGIKGLTLNGGYVTWVDDIATENALLLQCLEKAGAVFHVRTNQPQSLMHLCCSNNLTGTTLNPYNRTLTPGGSSGGEGASMGFKCAPLGIGTDIGGSIRCPAAFCGAYGFRPTARRNPSRGLKLPEPGHESILGVIGPFASQSVEDLELFQRAALDQEPWEVETSLVPAPWKRVEPTKDMTVAIMWDDGCVRPHPPVIRALKHAQEGLIAAGIKVVNWEPYKHDHGWEIISSLYFPDAAASQRALLAQTGEPILPLTEWAFQYSRPAPLTVAENWELNFQRDAYRDEYHGLMKSRGVDFILCPAYVGSAAVLGESHYWNYTAIWNILDQPAAVFPSGITVDPRLDAIQGETYQPRNAADDREWRKYTPERYVGAPIGLQLVGKHFRDEDTLAAAKLISTTLLTTMFFKVLDLTTALRPSLLPDETLLFVQDAVGLYEGKYKVANYQNGHVYLTSHRVCYVAAGFLKASPKITIYPKPLKNADRSRSSGASPSRSRPLRTQLAGTPSLLSQVSAPSYTPPPPNPVNATWVCPICSFSNPVPSNFDRSTATNSTPIPPCLACGIKPPFTTILKAAITAAASQEGSSTNPAAPQTAPGSPFQGNGRESVSNGDGSVTCPRCTFLNHPSLLECEICGASLLTVNPLRAPSHQGRSDSPAPIFEEGNIRNTDVSDNIKLSFRDGGEKIFLERLKGALIQRKWLLYNAPPAPQQPSQPQPTSSSDLTAASLGVTAQPRSPGVGIAGLERRGLEARRNNELVIGNAFEDLEALMSSAKQIVALAETLARDSGIASGETSAETSAVLSESAAALGMVTTKDMLGSSASSLYLSELSRNLAEYLTDDRKGVLQKEGGIISLIDLWSVFNRSRNGVELVSPSDFQRAAELWEKLKLPVRLRRFKSGLLVVQRYDWSDEKTLRQLQDWMAELRQIPPADPVLWDWRSFGCPVTAQEAAQRFGWSVGVAAEELEMAEDKGIFCREEGIEGLKFWSNYITFDPVSDNPNVLGISLIEI
ncbi:amidase signature domain-containing protein [Aspergillus cavernicola]|uniref:amidase n=1 Tax=Aspergillus cavernicola TaxID=176166 RepID=A0ABR4IYQ6_9EURO